MSNASSSLPPDRLIAAIAYAAKLHASQRRKVDGSPYLSHLLAVTALVMEHGGDESTAMAAVLHDAVEDQGGKPTRAEIARRFGEEIALLVDGCTDADTFPKPPWRERKEAFLAKLGTASPAVQLIVAADKLSNLRSMAREHRRLGEDLWRHFRGGREGTLWYFREVLAAIEKTAPASIVGELREEIARLAGAVAAYECDLPP